MLRTSTRSLVDNDPDAIPLKLGARVVPAPLAAREPLSEDEIFRRMGTFAIPGWITDHKALVKWQKAIRTALVALHESNGELFINFLDVGSPVSPEQKESLKAAWESKSHPQMRLMTEDEYGLHKKRMELREKAGITSKPTDGKEYASGGVTTVLHTPEIARVFKVREWIMGREVTIRNTRMNPALGIPYGNVKLTTSEHEVRGEIFQKTQAMLSQSRDFKKYILAVLEMFDVKSLSGLRSGQLDSFKYELESRWEHFKRMDTTSPKEL